ncbi:hypothetical protein G9A89_020243 [Geosiphon pyriformis]|nr:hypothetical protein G9A89_020243 [Geosiphon pyriformis]
METQSNTSLSLIKSAEFFLKKPSIKSSDFQVRTNVTDQELLDQFEKMARYAQQSYCLFEEKDHLEANIYDFMTMEFIVVIRGVELSRANWFIRPNFLVPYAVDKIWSWIPKVDNLFYTHFTKIQKKLFDRIEAFRISKIDWPIKFVGHGIGGVYAVFAGLNYRTRLPQLEIFVYTFGQPRIGDKYFALYTNFKLSKRVFRITYTDDYVPKLPFKIFPQSFDDEFYVHHETEYWIASDCDCYNSVYKCEGEFIPELGFLDECGLCNNSAYEPNSIIRGISSHNGPYFGHLMGFCPSV